MTTAIDLLRRARAHVTDAALGKEIDNYLRGLTVYRLGIEREPSGTLFQIELFRNGVFIGAVDDFDDRKNMTRILNEARSEARRDPYNDKLPPDEDIVIAMLTHLGEPTDPDGFTVA